MRIFILSFTVLFVVTIAISIATAEPKKDPALSLSTTSPGFAVVELFTSEGCSSCPAAEKVLNRIVADARKQNIAVYPLAFHVDYWNRLGWADRFSTARNSDRQRSYAQAMQSNDIYTPEMIVNGKEAFVGSDEPKAIAKINAALAEKPASTIKISAVRTDKKLKIHYEATGATNQNLNIAIVERKLETAVKRGENEGRKLVHDNVVRVFSSINLKTDETGDSELVVPDDLEIANSSIVVYVQNPQTMKIVAGAGIELP